METEPKNNRIEDVERLKIIAKLGQRLIEIGGTLKNKEVCDIGDAIINLGTQSGEFLAYNRANFENLIKDARTED